MPIHHSAFQDSFLKWARLLIAQHGSEAATVAVREGAERAARGDSDGVAMWRQIRRNIEHLQAAQA
jgi:hypothetical protein